MKKHFYRRAVVLILCSLFFCAHSAYEHRSSNQEANAMTAFSSPLKRGVYRHYKGNLYLVHGIARHSETLQEVVVYQALQGDFGIWVRPLSMFLDSLEYKEAIVPRFTFVQETGLQAPASR